MNLVDQAELFDVFIFVPVVREVMVPLVYARYVEVTSTGRADDDRPRIVRFEGKVVQVLPGFVGFFEVSFGFAFG